MDQAQANPAPEASISDRLSAYLAAEVPADNKAPQEAQEPADNAPVEAADDAEYVDAQSDDAEAVTAAEDEPTEEIKDKLMTPILLCIKPPPPSPSGRDG